MTIPFYTDDDVRQAVPPLAAHEAVRRAFLTYSAGEWTMPPKVYVPSYPAGDFRAMPAVGGGHALLKWVSSFPGNPRHGLPTVSGIVLLSDAETGELQALLGASALTALRTAAAGVIAAETLARRGAEDTAVIGCGVNGAETARMLAALGHTPVVWDIDPERSSAVAEATGAVIAPSLAAALRHEAVITVTPGASIVIDEGTLRPGQHVSLIGADGPGKAEIALGELQRGRLYCDDWEQASHGGELAVSVAAGLVSREHVTQLGDVLAGKEDGRRSATDITLFDSTGLAIQDLAIAIAAYSKADELDLQAIEL